jgi:hypothetical protein
VFVYSQLFIDVAACDVQHEMVFCFFKAFSNWSVHINILCFSKDDHSSDLVMIISGDMIISGEVTAW